MPACVGPGGRNSGRTGDSDGPSTCDDDSGHYGEAMAVRVILEDRDQGFEMVECCGYYYYGGGTDALVRRLLTETSASDVLVEPARLEEAFLGLTESDAS